MPVIVTLYYAGIAIQMSASYAIFYAGLFDRYIVVSMWCDSERGSIFLNNNLVRLLPSLLMNSKPGWVPLMSKCGNIPDTE